MVQDRFSTCRYARISNWGEEDKSTGETAATDTSTRERRASEDQGPTADLGSDDIPTGTSGQMDPGDTYGFASLGTGYLTQLAEMIKKNKDIGLCVFEKSLVLNL